MKLLCAADLHLGRIPSRLPDALGVRPSDLTPAAAWRALVDTALRERADAVLLAGDVVEDRRDFFEAYADLHEGVTRLREAGVAVVAVTGNHDVEVLPRLAAEVEGLHLLGRGGRWECLPFEAGGRRVRIVGWSFPAERVTTSPLRDGLGDALDGSGTGPVIGLLHGDLDRTGSPYAPFRSRELRDAPVDAWLLGHVHAPDAMDGDRPIGYLGSLAAGDPGEEGARGAWRLTIGDGADAAGPGMDRLPLAPLRYETVEVPLDDLAHASEASGAIVRALGRLHERLRDEREALRAVGCRIVLTGRTALRDEVRRALTDEDPRRLRPELDGVRYFVHAWRIDARPAVDLEALAHGGDPVAIVARTLLTLREGDSEARRRLLADARPRLAAVVRQPAFAPLGRAEPGDDEVAERLRTAALRALDALLAQRGGPDG